MDEVYSSKIEEKINALWKKRNIIKKLSEKNKGKQKFYFLDGPPYVTNQVHEGTLLNIFLKDSIIRYKYLSGYDVWAQPGWDTHGLPIEVAVEKELGIKNKHEIVEFGEDKFIKECKSFAERYIKINTDILLDYGLIWFYNKPYKTYDDNYIENVWAVIKRADEKGLLYHGSRATWFCVRCSTPMSNYEVRDKYYPKEDPSIYVLFHLKDGRYLLVWTTTPWTLPSNAAVAVNSEADYIEVSSGDKHLIIAKSRKEVLDKFVQKYEIVREFKGSELIGLRYEHPFADIPQIKENLDKICVIIDGKDSFGQENEPFVNLNEGTGAVHVAPGHGLSDYKIGTKLGLPIMSPINEDGTYKDSAGWLKGKYLFSANEEIIKYLKEKGLLLAEEKITHDYPHCWRCSTPLVQIATNQWFLDVTKIKEELIKIAEDIHWVPEISKQSFLLWLSNIEDWVISRQRYWNTPLPIWECSKCGNRIVVGSKEELSKLSGVKRIKDLHKTTLSKIEIKCPVCGEKMRRVDDVIDVWVDSGAAASASIDYLHNKEMFDKLFPVDFICEANEQIRGWFYSLLVLGYVFTDKLPYKSGIMHKFVIGEDRKKLSKSAGNYKPVDQLIKEGYSRDALRISLLKHRLEDEVVFSMKDVMDSTKTLNLMFNLARLLDMVKDKNRSKFSTSYKAEDAWILSRWNRIKKKIIDAVNDYRVDEGINELIDFAENDLSKTYLKLAKPRMLEEEDESALFIFSKIMEELSIISAIFIPFMSEYLYSVTHKNGSVLLESLPKIDEENINEGIESRMNKTLDLVQDILAYRDKNKLPVKRPISSITIFGLNKDEIIEEILKTLANIIEVNYNLYTPDIELSLNIPHLKERYNSDDITKIAGKFIELTHETIIRNVNEINLSIDGKTYKLNKDDILIKSKKEGTNTINAEASGSILLIDASMNDEVLKRWAKREIIRAVQDIRKQSSLKRSDEIGLEINAKENLLDEKSIDEIYSKTNAKKRKGSLIKLQTISINGEEVLITVYK